ncbi:SDR family oxidoreductase [Nocardia sp. N2S4-5]|uniref:SDR family oxidoreductase n=1 Tax=Nocardia sp. N2S4-5 TaxID=3351565 RepID=UPI0037D3F8BB
MRGSCSWARSPPPARGLSHHDRSQPARRNHHHRGLPRATENRRRHRQPSSVAGRTAHAGNGGYAATKWGMNGWSESLRQELLPAIRVTLIEPGVVDTELPTHITHEETREAVQKGYDAATVTPEDIAEVIAFTLTRPRHLAINEILLRPADQLG